MTYTYATMEVSQATFEEVRSRLIAAGYVQRVSDEEEPIDMSGIALALAPCTCQIEKTRRARHLASCARRKTK